MIPFVMTLRVRPSRKRRNSFVDTQFDDVVVDIPTDTSLSTIIKNDLLYGVGNRSTIPSCFEDDAELAQDGVDPLADMRHDSWHDVSVAMNPQFSRTEQTIELGSGGDDPKPTDPPTDE